MYKYEDDIHHVIANTSFLREIFTLTLFELIDFERKGIGERHFCFRRHSSFYIKFVDIYDITNRILLLNCEKSI